jgi:hypothetical protein
MRTKTLLLATAIGAVGIATSMAQVYSQNAVGYYNKDLVVGFNLLVNQFNNGGNEIGTVLPAAPDGAIALTWNETIQSFRDGDIFVEGFGWVDLSTGELATTIPPPGEAFFINSPVAATMTFVGEVPEGTEEGGDPLVLTFSPGFSFKGQATPQSLALDSGADAIPAQDGDILLFYVESTQAYNDGWIYVGDLASWFNLNSGEIESPTPEVGQGFVYNNSGGALTWTRSFEVN